MWQIMIKDHDRNNAKYWTALCHSWRGLWAIISSKSRSLCHFFCADKVRRTMTKLPPPILFRFRLYYHPFFLTCFSHSSAFIILISFLSPTFLSPFVLSSFISPSVRRSMTPNSFPLPFSLPLILSSFLFFSFLSYLAFTPSSLLSCCLHFFCADKVWRTMTPNPRPFPFSLPLILSSFLPLILFSYFSFILFFHLSYLAFTPSSLPLFELLHLLLIFLASIYFMCTFLLLFIYFSFLSFSFSLNAFLLCPSDIFIFPSLSHILPKFSVFTTCLPNRLGSIFP